MDKLVGLIILYIAFNLSYNVLSLLGIFVLFLNATVAIITSLGAWNDFLLPLVLLSHREMAKLPLVQYIFQGQFSTEICVLLNGTCTLIIMYILAQKRIISGVMKGSIK
ncbi:hypothetical protein [Cytobacillus firmus]|uniref:hypothetical protein n=1 Tax=Cytobacillus firmus TaxID=1399 RepID=UPI002162B0AA|nr:hypothetical protein [Cytobacillus firmus]MCS0671362.1 hypothetical protein [Cytobacillus firmus]